MTTNRYSPRMRRRNPRHQRFSRLLTIALICVLPVAAALAQQLCFPPVATPSGPPNFSAPPLIDGSIANGDPRCFNNLPNIGCNGPDLGWATAFGYVFNNPDGPVTPDVIVEGNTDGNYLYLSVQANNSSTQTSSSPTDANNAVVVAFDPDNTGTKMQWLVIYVTNGSEIGNKNMAQQVDYYWNQGSLSSPLTDSHHYMQNPNWLYGAGGTATSTSWQTNCFPANSTVGAKPCLQSDLEGASWSMEIALPLHGLSGDPSTGLILPNNKLFGMYVDVLRVTGTPTPSPGWEQWSQAPWPSGGAIPGCTSNTACFLDYSIPNPPSLSSPPSSSVWGSGTIQNPASPSCNGLSIGSQNLAIKVTNSANPAGSNAIDAMNPNTFSALVNNTGPQADNVAVTFYIANFGLPSIEWQQVAVSQPPLPTGSNISPGGTTLTSNSWTPPASQLATYLAHPHQCILATLSSNPPSTTPPTGAFFTNASAVQNANFFDLSSVKSPVEVSAKGYPANPEHSTTQEFDLYVTTKQSVLRSCVNGGTPVTTAGQATKDTVATQGSDCSQIVETAEACRHTGTYLSNNNKQKIEICQPVGSFTFVGKHQGTGENLTYSLTGPGLSKPDNNGIYHLTLPNNSVVDLNNVLQAGAGGGGGGGCSSLFGFSVWPLFGGVIVVGLLVYRKPKRDITQTPESHIESETKE